MGRSVLIFFFYRIIIVSKIKLCFQQWIFVIEFSDLKYIKY